MKSSKNNNASDTLFLIAVGAILTVVGFLCIPPPMRKHSNKVYKTSLKKGTYRF